MKTSLKSLLLLFPLCCALGWSEDFVGGGEEADPGEVPVAPRNEPWPPPSSNQVLEPTPDGAKSGILKPVSTTQLDAQTPTNNAAAPQTDPLPIKTADAGGSLLGDLTADQPGAEPLKKKGPFWVELPDLKPTGNVSALSAQAFSIVADMKTHVYKISEDLDGGGKERTRLIFTTEALGKDINKALALWSNDENFRDVCRITKSRVIALEEELRAQPRKWTHIRWAFRSVQKEIGNLRQVTAAKAEGEAQPLRVKTKDGKTILIEAPRDPKEIAREEAEARRALSNSQRDKLKDQVEGERKRKEQKEEMGN